MRKTIKAKIITESLWDRLPQHVKDEINGIINSKPKEMVEVVHGEWKIDRDCEGKTQTLTCNRCGWKSGKYTWELYYYCPHCGARMDGEEE